jgi:UDP-glucose 4-epimerase
VQGVVSTFLKRIHAGLPIEIWGDGGVVRDYLYVADLAAICAVAAESKIVGVFNAGSGEGHSLNEIIEMIRRVTGKTIKIEYKPSRPVDVPRSVLQVSRAEATFAWRCTISLEEGISESWKWLNEQPA